MLRHTPIGEDAQGSRYFFLSDDWEDCRVYRQRLPLHEEASVRASGSWAPGKWETICLTLEDVEELSERFAGSKNKAEQSLHARLAKEIVPGLKETQGARKKASERAAASEAAPRKRSSRLQVRIQTHQTP